MVVCVNLFQLFVSQCVVLLGFVVLCVCKFERVCEFVELCVHVYTCVYVRARVRAGKCLVRAL